MIQIALTIVKWSLGITLGLLIVGVIEVAIYMILWKIAHIFLERTDK